MSVNTRAPQRSAGVRSSNSGLRSARSGAGRPPACAVAALPLLTLGLVNARHRPLAGRRPAAVSACGRRGFGRRRLLAGRRHGGRVGAAAQLVPDPAAAHADHRGAAKPAGIAAVHRRRGQREQHRPPGGPPRGGCRPQLVRRGRAARAGPHRARRRRHPGLGARPADRRRRRPRRTARKHGRHAGSRWRAAGSPPTRVSPSEVGDRAAAAAGSAAAPHRRAAAGEPPRARRHRRSGGRGPRPRPAAHPGRPGGGARRSQSRTHRAADGRQPRSAHAAGLDQGGDLEPAPGRPHVVAGGRDRPCSPRSKRVPTGSKGSSTTCST